MKKLFFALGFVMLTLQGGCQEDKTFKVPVIFEQGFKFSTNGTLQTIPYTGGGTVADWNTMLNKPLTFPPATHNHDALYKPIGYMPTWAEITGKPTLFDGTWISLTGKPTFATIATTGSYIDLKDKPTTIELQDAISQMPGLIPARLTQTQINALTPVEGLEVWNLTIHAKQAWNGTIWKTYITGN